MMMRIVLLIFLMTISLFGLGQEQKDSIPKFVIKGSLGGKRGIDTTTNIKTRWALFGIGTTTYLGTNGFKLQDTGTPGTGDNAFALKVPRSINLNIHLYRQRINLAKHKFNLVHGLVYDFYKYHFKYGTVLQPNQPHVSYTQDSISYRKNSLKTSFVTLPVLFNYESNPGNSPQSFRVSAGAYASILLYAKTKRNSKDTPKVRLVDDFNLNQFRYGLRGEVGYRDLSLYVTWAMNSLFKEGETPELYPFTVGLMLLPF